MVEKDHPGLSITRQCELLTISRSSFYYTPRGEAPLNLELMRLIDAQFLETPWYGARQMARHLRRQGHLVGRKRMRRLMQLMGLETIYSKPRTSAPHPGHKVYPYLLRDLAIERPNQVWCADVTYIPLRRGFLYLVAIMDWASRRVLAWRLSNTLDVAFCMAALEDALAGFGAPDIFNTDQGSQFTSLGFTGRLEAAGIRISMDGSGAASSMSASISTPSRRGARRAPASGGGSPTTIPNVRIRRSVGGRPARPTRDTGRRRRRHERRFFGPAPACGYVDDPLRGPAALPPGSPQRGKPGEMLAFAHIPTGTTTNNHDINMSGEFTAGHHLNLAGNCPTTGGHFTARALVGFSEPVRNRRSPGKSHRGIR